MSPDETIKRELWRAFFLGVRATLVGHDIALTNAAIKTAVDKMEAVADGSETIYDPSADAGFFGAPDENVVDRMNKAFRSDRQLAQEIAAGLEIVQRGR